MTPEEIAELRKRGYNATVTLIRKVHSDLLIMRIRPDFPLPKHQPGQYSSLGMGNWEPRHPGCQDEEIKPENEKKIVRRAYSIGCSILDDNNKLLNLAVADWLEFYIVLVRKSEKPQAPALTPRLFLLREGDRINLGEKITGHYTLDPVQPGDTVIFLSTGTGEAPNDYMLWELLTKGHLGRIVSACCVRYRKDLAYLSIHQELMKQFANYSFLPLTTREADTLANKVYIQDLIATGQLEATLGQTLDPAHTQVFLCGNPSMIGVPVKDRDTGQFQYPSARGVIEILEKRGFRADQAQSKEKGNIHFEEYW